jgi:uncharacterized protein YjbI with pentapeptide repeats
MQPRIMAETIEPLDVAALEKSVNDSAVRVSTIWVSFLLFGLYLAVAAGNVTHRQLFLEEAIKLPTLNIDMPLAAFFLLAPLLFAVFHLYVLVQVVLLARTAVAYDAAVTYNLKVASDRALIRQRLANTLFAQILAGSPFEREGVLGLALHAICWGTLVILPAFVLLVFQFKFLPYHSDLMSWAHRILTAFSLVMVVLLWPSVLDGRLNISWKHVKRHPCLFLWCLLFFLLSFGALGFPGAAGADWLPRHQNAVDSGPIVDGCGQTILAVVFGPHVDRLIVRGEDVTDEDRLAKIATSDGSYEGEPMKDFRDRDLSCGTFADGNFSYSDFRGAKMVGVNFQRAYLTGARLQGAQLRGANLQGASLQKANLSGTHLQEANLSGARLQSADLTDARLQSALALGTTFSEARLNNASLENSTLTDAKLDRAVLHEATLTRAQLHRADLRAASLNNARLNKAMLERADLSGASLLGAWLDEASLHEADLRHAILRGARLREASLTNAQLQNASLREANLLAARLDDADLTGAELTGSNLRRASLRRAQLSGLHFQATDLHDADLTDAILEKASFNDAKLQGAFLTRALLSDADLSGANLQGAWLNEAKLQRALFFDVKMQAARLDKAELQDAVFDDAWLQSTSFADADLRGVSFTSARLQAAFFTGATLDHARFAGSQLRRATIANASLWRTTGADCDDAQVTEPRFDAKASAVDKEIEIDDVAVARNEQNWRNCADKALSPEHHEQELSVYVIELACRAGADQEYVARGVFLNLDKEPFRNTTSMRRIAKSFLEFDGSTCPGARALSESTKKRLQEVAETVAPH